MTRTVSLNFENTVRIETDLPAPSITRTGYKFQGKPEVRCSLCGAGYREDDARTAAALAVLGFYTPVCTPTICSADLADLQIANGL